MIFCVMMNIFTILFILEGLGILTEITFEKKFKMPFTVVLVLLLLWYYLYKNRYKKIVEKYNNIENDFIKSVHPILVILVYSIVSFGLVLLAGMFKNHYWIFQNI